MAGMGTRAVRIIWSSPIGRTWMRGEGTYHRALLGAVGIAAGIGAGLFSYARLPSWMLAAFVTVMVSYTIAHAADILAARYRLQRAAYVALFPVAGTLFLVAFYLVWGHIDLAVLLGCAGGAIVQAAFNPAIVGPQ